MDKIRRPPLIVAGVLMVLVVLIEIGAAAFIGSGSGDGSEMESICTEEGLDKDKVKPPEGAKDGPPGLGIPFLAFIDIFLLRYILLGIASLIVSKKNLGRIQGIATLILSLLVIIGGIIALFVTIGLLILKISLFLAVPFGTLVYLAMFAFFAKPEAASVLGTLFVLKLVAGILLVVAQQNFLKSKSLILLFLTSLLGGIVVSFLHGLVPIFLVSITDNIAALVALILGLIWAVINLVGSIVSVVKLIT